jgi:hypothetical protein
VMDKLRKDRISFCSFWHGSKITVFSGHKA